MKPAVQSKKNAARSRKLPRLPVVQPSLRQSQNRLSQHLLQLLPALLQDVRRNSSRSLPVRVHPLPPASLEPYAAAVAMKKKKIVAQPVVRLAHPAAAA